MLTWLDWYVYGAGRKLPGAENDLEAARQMCLATLAQYSAGLSPRPTQDLAFYSMLFPFLIQGSEDLINNLPSNFSEGLKLTFSARGIRLSKELARDLSLARAPESERHRYEVLLHSHTWYIDVPHKALLLDDSHQIRAIFTQPTLGKETAAALAVLTPPGQDKMLGRYAWMMIGEDKIYGDPMDVEADFVRESVTEFVRLVLLYHSIAQGQELPYLPPTRKFEKKKKAQAAQKKYSLFRIHCLDSPPDHFGRPEKSLGGDSWRLDHRVPVRGHFRMQPHGPESKLRKLTWIDAHYRGPEDGAEKVLLDRLKRSRR